MTKLPAQSLNRKREASLDVSESAQVEPRELPSRRRGASTHLADSARFALPALNFRTDRLKCELQQRPAERLAIGAYSDGAGTINCPLSSDGGGRNIVTTCSPMECIQVAAQAVFQEAVSCQMIDDTAGAAPLSAI